MMTTAKISPEETKLLKLSPLGLGRLTKPRFSCADHLQIINDALMDINAGILDRLMIMMPPRHGKSTLCSELLPANHLALNPEHEVLMTSYGADYAAEWGAKTRDLMVQHGSRVYNMTIKQDVAARANWGIRGHEGRMFTAGVGGSLTGRGADLLIIDDPVKDAKEANSKTYRDRAWEWYQSTAYTRLEPNGRIVLIMTRWHEDDLAGRILDEMENGGDQWRVISMPGLDQEGYALWPRRYPVKRLRGIQRAIGPYWWSALYNQRPAPFGGNLFKRINFRYFRELWGERGKGGYYALATPDGLIYVDMDTAAVFITVDTAETTTTQADYTVAATWALTPANDLLLLDILRVRVEAPEVPPLMTQLNQRWHPSYISIEGTGVYQACRKLGLPVRQLHPQHDKWTRAQPAAARMYSGNVYHLAGTPWLAEYEKELGEFDKGVHDDQVDVFAYAGIIASRNAGIGMIL